MNLPHTLKSLTGALLLGAVSLGAKAPDLTPGEVDRVKSIVDGDTLYLNSGLKVRLSALQAPKLPLGRPDFEAWPLAEDAKDTLSNLALGRQVQLYYGGLTRDRYDRALAQVYLLDKNGKRDIWLQEAMIQKGMGRVYTWPDTWQDSDRLLNAERQARRGKKGIWAHPYYRVRSPDANILSQDIDSFQIVEGLVVKSAEVKGRVYLNFGSDYRTDFTVVIARKDRKKFKTEPYQLEKLYGHRVRVRGWVEFDNGPVIWLDHPERLEVLK